jgi:hypothetical protein
MASDRGRRLLRRGLPAGTPSRFVTTRTMPGCGALTAAEARIRAGLLPTPCE